MGGNLGKNLIKSVAAKRVAATFVAAAGGSARKSRFPTCSEQSKKWPVQSSPSFSYLGGLHNRPVPLIPTCSILPLFDFVEAGISTTADKLS